MDAKCNIDGAKIKTQRIKRGWTQEQLAEIAGVSSRTIQRTETKSSASLETLRAVAAAFDTDSDQLLLSGNCLNPGPETRLGVLPERLTACRRQTIARLRLHFTIAAALVAGFLLGVLLMHRVDRPVPWQPSAPLSTAAPARTEAGHRIQPETEAQPNSRVHATPVPMIKPAIHKRHVEPAAETSAYHVPGGLVAETHEPATIEPQTTIQFPMRLESFDSIPPSRGLLASFANMEAPADWSARCAFSDVLPKNEAGMGAVRQAVGVAGKKMGEAIASVASSMKRVF